MAQPLRRRIDALEMRGGGQLSGGLVLFGGGQCEDEVRAFLKLNGFPEDIRRIVFHTVYEDRDGNSATDQQPLSPAYAA